MNSTLRFLIAHVFFWLSTLPNTFRFFGAIRNVERTQKKILLQILAANKNSKFGKKHSFGRIHTPEEFRTRVPIQTYEDFLPFINEVATGGGSILTEDPVRMFEPTSGSASASKLIPYTASLKVDFRRGIDPWIFSLYLKYPRLFIGSVYWSITPAHSKNRYTECGIPIGFSEDGEYFGALQKWVLDTVSAAPTEVKKIEDIETFRYCTLLFLLARKNLRLISVWNPTYLVILLKDLPRLLPELVLSLRSRKIPKCPNEIRRILETKLHCPSGRIRELEELVCAQRDSEKTLYESIWPKLSVISCWTDGLAHGQVKDILQMLPRVAIQPKGLLATEMFVSFPFFSRYSVLSVNSHFFEFEEVGGAKQVVFAHEVERNKQYRMIVTTNGGLYRYDIGDIVEVHDFWRGVPVLKFIGRGDKVVDCVGEKLNETFVEKAIGALLSLLDIKAEFWMVAPEKISSGCYRYVLFLESKFGVTPAKLTELEESAEKAFQDNYYYQYARSLGQLASLAVFVIKPEDSKTATEFFLETSYRLGQRFGAIKMVRLHRYENWAKEFSGYYV